MKGESEKSGLFSKGSQVEVSSDEDGFKGAWFVATIVEPQLISKPVSKKKKQQQHNDAFLVEYHSLVADDGSSKPLKEYVQASFIRPLPSIEDTDDVSFELNDVVDAFYRDGWWAGVITGVVENSRFRVFFQNPPEEVEFGRLELRVHQEWVDGQWVRPEKQGTTGLHFSTGEAVEVNIGKENSCDVWYPAIFRKEIGNNSFLVDYKSSRNGDEANILKATVDSLHIRPHPPDLGDKNFELLEKVDAFFNFGWWSGIITKVLTGRRYRVFFKHINKDMELSHSELRTHTEWTDGKWLNGSQEVIIPLNHQEQLEQAHNNSNDTEMAIQLETSGVVKNSTEEKTCSTNSRKNQMEESSPRSEKSPSYTATLSKKKIKHIYHYSDATLSKPSKKLKKSEAPLSVTTLQLPIETLTKEALSGSATLTTGGTGTNCSKHAVVGDQPPARVRRKKVETKQQRGSVLVNEKTDFVKRKEGKPRKSLLKSPKVSVSVKDGNAGEVEVPDVMEKSKKMSSSKAKDSFQRPNEESPKLMRDQKEPVRSKSMELKQQKEVGVKTQIKRRGRPRKLVIESPKVSVAGEKNNGAGVAAAEMIVLDCTDNEVELPSTGVESTGTRFIRGQKKLLTNLERDSQDASQEKTAEVTGTHCAAEGIEVTVVEVSNNMADDDRPLSMWFEGMHSPTIVDDPRLSPGRIVKAQERQDGSAVQPCAIDFTSDDVPDENKKLPFVKNSPIWKMIESLEVYQMTPQKPHFHPLKKCKEECREGLAIGNMVTFANLVEKISKLQFDDSRSIIDSSLETLLDLEMHGFDVEAIRGRLKDLLSIKNRQAKLCDQSKEAERQILEHTQEKIKIDEEIDEIDKKIRDLQEKRAMDVSTKESKDSEIAALRSSLDVINEGIWSAPLDFEKLVAAPW